MVALRRKKKCWDRTIATLKAWPSVQKNDYKEYIHILILILPLSAGETGDFNFLFHVLLYCLKIYVMIKNDFFFPICIRNFSKAGDTHR